MMFIVLYNLLLKYTNNRLSYFTEEDKLDKNIIKVTNKEVNCLRPVLPYLDKPFLYTLVSYLKNIINKTSRKEGLNS